MAVDRGKFGTAREIVRLQLSVDAGCVNFAADAVNIQLAIDQLDFIQPRRARDGQRVFHTRRDCRAIPN